MQGFLQISNRLWLFKYLKTQLRGLFFSARAAAPATRHWISGSEDEELGCFS
jgi:hypothetical protein